MTTALKDSTLARETYHEVGGRKLVVTLTPGGITLHPKGTQRKMKIAYLALFLQLEAEERRGGQSEITIAPRKGRRS